MKFFELKGKKPSEKHVAGRSSRPRAQPVKPSVPSSSTSPARQAIRTMYTRNHDVKMATQQADYEHLTEALKSEQNTWAQQKILESGPCITGFDFHRVENGYRCVGGSETHFIPDASLVLGDRSFYIRTDFPPANFVNPWPEKEADTKILGSDGYWWIGPFFATTEQLRAAKDKQKQKSLENARSGRLADRPEKGPEGTEPTVQQVKRTFYDASLKHKRKDIEK